MLSSRRSGGTPALGLHSHSLPYHGVRLGAPDIPRVGEAIVLRTWPFLEADLLVSLFPRDQGRIKGVARHALRSRKRFGGALEPMTYVRASYAERPKQELVRLDAFEILSSPLARP